VTGTDVFGYFGLQSPHTVAGGILAGDPAELTQRATTVQREARTLDSGARTISSCAARLASSWSGEAADRAVAALHRLADGHAGQAAQLAASAASLVRVADALATAQATVREILRVAATLDVALRSAIRAATVAVQVLCPGAALVNGILRGVTDVDVFDAAGQIFADFLAPVRAAAVDVLLQLFDVVDDYDAVLRREAGTLRTMPGIVDPEAGPTERPGDTALREGALFWSVYGRWPHTETELLMARALDVQLGDPGNTDPNTDITVLRITPVPGSGVIQGNAFIADDQVANFPEPDLGDDRGFDPDASPGASRVSFFVDYENGVVVVRQNASHSVGGDAKVGVPSIGVEQDDEGRVRIRLEATNPLAPGPGQLAHVSVRSDLVVDPDGGTGPATVNGKVTRYPSWEVYQHRDGQPTGTLLQRAEDEQPFGTGPLVGLPQPTVPVGESPAALDEWRAEHHPDQGHDPWPEELLELPGTRGDDFFDYDLPPAPHPRLAPDGDLVLPHAQAVG